MNTTNNNTFNPIGGYIFATLILLMSFFGLSFLPPIVCILFSGVMFIGCGYASLKSKENNKKVDISNKYLKYIKDAHSEIPEKYIEAIHFKICQSHGTEYKEKWSTSLFDAETLDKYIAEFMANADENLTNYAKENLK